MKTIAHKLKRLIQQKYIKLARLSNPQLKKSAYERDCIAICKKLIDKDDFITSE
jgi:hypothetical protein